MLVDPKRFYVDYSPIAGLGLFTNARIKEGDYIWVFDPGKDKEIDIMRTPLKDK